MAANGFLLPPEEKPILKPKIDWLPTISIKIGRLSFQLGRIGKVRQNDNPVYGLLELTEEVSLGAALYWINDDIPMFGLFLWPMFFVTCFWCYPGPELQ